MDTLYKIVDIRISTSACEKKKLDLLLERIRELLRSRLMAKDAIIEIFLNNDTHCY